MSDENFDAGIIENEAAPSTPHANATTAAGDQTKQEIAILNSLSSLIGLVGGGANPYGGAAQGQQLSQTTTQYLNLRAYLISNMRSVLSQMYVQHGIVQTLIDAPVDDSFRSGYEIKTDQLSPDEIEQLIYFAEQVNLTQEVANTCKWGRLFGGASLIVVTEQDAQTELDLESIKEGSRLKFIAADLWELYSDIQIGEGAAENLRLDDGVEFYTYYGKKIHRSRVFTFKGKQAPSWVRPQLRGWGMSEIERLVRSLNSYVKNQDVVFELLDEAKIDIFKIKGLNASLLTTAGTANVAKRIQAANMLKNYQSALTMDMGDEYEQKTINFSGLGDMLTQIRQGVAADCKFPMTKLFGISAAGFNSGEDDIENYNSMVEGEVRAKVKYLVVQALQICCAVKFGFIPDDLKIIWNPLRILGAEEEEKVKKEQFDRVMTAYKDGLIPDDEAKAAINKAHLLPIEIDESLEADKPLAAKSAESLASIKGDQAKGDDDKKKKSKLFGKTKKPK